MASPRLARKLFHGALPARRHAMHRLHLLRHAKSSWDETVEDHERPLSRRGDRAAQLVGASLPAAIGRLDLVLCSSAVRTRATLDLVLSGFAQPPRCLLEDGLYLAGSAQLLNRLRQLDEAADEVMLIGHNPGLQELAVALADPASAGYPALAAGKFPTAARVSFAIPTPWSSLGGVRCPVVDYVTPKSLGGEE
jgi:phosphohistidine phosphatase